MTKEVCPNGHVRTESNTSFTKVKNRVSMRKWCLDCRKVSKPNTDSRTVDERIEDIEDLVRFGATFQEILERCGFTNWKDMQTALRRKGKDDLIETLKIRGAIQIGKNRFTN